MTNNEENEDVEELEGVAEGGEKELSYLPQRGGAGEGLGYDNEWVRLLDKLSKDSSLADIVDYLKIIKLTPRCKAKLQVTLSTLLDPEFAVSKISDQQQMWMVTDERDILLCEMSLGLTRFDITPEYEHVLNLLSTKFAIKLLRSVGGFERKIMATTRTENVSEERVRNAPKRGVKETVMNLWR